GSTLLPSPRPRRCNGGRTFLSAWRLPSRPSLTQSTSSQPQQIHKRGRTCCPSGGQECPPSVSAPDQVPSRATKIPLPPPLPRRTPYPRRMQPRESQPQGLNVLAIDGEIDLACSPDLRAILHGFAKKRVPALVLDFQQVSYVDSSGLATLVEYVRLAQDYGGK